MAMLAGVDHDGFGETDLTISFSAHL